MLKLLLILAFVFRPWRIVAARECIKNTVISTVLITGITMPKVWRTMIALRTIAGHGM